MDSDLVVGGAAAQLIAHAATWSQRDRWRLLAHVLTHAATCGTSGGGAAWCARISYCLYSDTTGAS